VDDFGDLFGSVGDALGELLGGDAGPAGASGIAAFLSPEARRRRDNDAPRPCERYLCGEPRELNINDR